MAFIRLPAIGILHRLGSVPSGSAGFMRTPVLGLLHRMGAAGAETGGLRHYPARRPRRYVDLSKRPRGFSRKYWEELKAAEAAQAALEKRAEAEKRDAERQALLNAAFEAWEAIAEARNADAINAQVERELGQLTRAMGAAAGARSISGILAAADVVIAAAAAMQAEIEDEEEAILLLLT